MLCCELCSSGSSITQQEALVNSSNNNNATRGESKSIAQRVCQRRLVIVYKEVKPQKQHMVNLQASNDTWYMVYQKQKLRVTNPASPLW